MNDLSMGKGWTSEAEKGLAKHRAIQTTEATDYVVEYAQNINLRPRWWK